MNICVNDVTTPDLPMTMSSLSRACGRMCVQMSMVNSVLLLLKMDASDDINAASITANIRPRKPGEHTDNIQVLNKEVNH